MPSDPSGFDIRQFVGPRGWTYEKEILMAAEKLRSCIVRRVWRAYLSQPKVSPVTRTGHVAKALQIDLGKGVQANGNTLSVDLAFDDSIMMPSVMKKYKGANVNTMKLLNYGFKHSDSSPTRRIKYFGWRKGAHFIEDGIDDFNRTWGAKMPFTLRINANSIYNNRKDYYS